MTSQDCFFLIGGASGIGKATALELKKQNARLVLCGRKRETLEAFAEEIDVPYIQADATKEEELSAALQQAHQEFGPLKGVANFAGSILLKPAHRTSYDEWLAVMHQNLTSAFLTVKHAAPLLKTRTDGSSIVLMSSVAGKVGLPNHEAIAAAKAGVIGLVLSAAATYAKSNIRVNAVAPGLVETPMSANLLKSEASRKASIAMHPLNQLGKPEDLCETIAWLLSDRSRWVTGQVFSIDGGMSHVKS